MYIFLRHSKTKNTDEAGFVLILAMVILLVVSLFGIWALQTSTSELRVAGGSQQIEKQFNITEGASYSESGKIGFSLQPFYQVFDPDDAYQLLLPSTALGFDPGDDTDTPRATIATQANGYAGELVPLDTWPWENMLSNYNNLPVNTDEFDYRYLTTYLFPDTAPLGYDATLFNAYKFRIQTAAAQTSVTVELGGTKIGPK